MVNDHDLHRTACEGVGIASAMPRAAALADARLSIGHKTSNPNSALESKSARPAANLFQVWKDGSLAIFPSIPNLNPNQETQGANRGGKRGKVSTYSDASRRNCQLFLAKLNRQSKAFTMALTLPGNVEFLTSAKVHLAFKTLCNRLTASRLFPDVSFVWKRELQRRGALHYHLLLYGLENEGVRTGFHRWIAENWNDSVSIGLSEREKKKHFSWHSHTKNMEAVRGNIAGYFAKYLGKPLETVSEVIPGRWWGKINLKALPLSVGSEMPMPKRAAIIAHRIARKIAFKRANEARHRTIARTMGLTDANGEPRVSQFGLLALRDRIRHIDHGNIDWGCFPGRTQRALDYLILMPSLKGLRWGKSRRSKFAKYSRVKLISNQSPATAFQIMRFVREEFKEWIAKNPF